jgi:hypothetical protein
MTIAILQSWFFVENVFGFRGPGRLSGLGLFLYRTVHQAGINFRTEIPSLAADDLQRAD